MILQAFPSGPYETNAYIIGCPETKIAAIIDPAPDSSRALLHFLSQNSLHANQIVLTHSHWDHIADVAFLKEKLNLSVAIHSLDADNLRQPGIDGLPCRTKIEGVEPDALLADGDSIHIGNILFHVIHTPGHTPGGICLYCQNEGVLISGDTLFKGTIGNLSFPTARPELMWNSLDKLSKLPGQTRVFPGHGLSTTIEAEKWLPEAKKMFDQT